MQCICALEKERKGDKTCWDSGSARNIWRICVSASACRAHVMRPSNYSKRAAGALVSVRRMALSQRAAENKSDCDKVWQKRQNLFSLPKHKHTAPGTQSGYAPLFQCSIGSLRIFFELSEWSMKLWAKYFHQNHWFVTPATISRLLLLFVFLSKIICTCMGGMWSNPVKLRRDSARQ